jgi:hypothetical protein
VIKRSTLIIVIIFVVLLIITLIFQSNQNERNLEATPITSSSYLIDIGNSEIIALDVKSADGNQIIMKIDTDGKWVLELPAGEIADQTRIETAVSQASNLRTISKLEAQVDLADMGLDQPIYIIVATLSDGEQKAAFIGDPTPTGSGYYAYLNGEAVQIVNKTNIDSIIDMLINPPIQSQTEIPGE